MANRTANMAKINQIQQTEMIRRRAKELGIGAVPRPVPPPPKKGKKRKVNVPLGPQRVIFNPPGPTPAPSKLDVAAYEEWKRQNYPAQAARRAGSPPSITQQPTGAIPGPAAVPKPTMFGKTPSQQQAAIAAPPSASPNVIITPTGPQPPYQKTGPYGGITTPIQGGKPTKPIPAAQQKLASKPGDKTIKLVDRAKYEEAQQAKVDKYKADALERGRQRKQEELSQLTGFEQLARAAEGIPQNTSVFLEGLPAPGGVALPLLLLLVLFLLVLPVKGADGAIHTRAMWLWRVVTGNASLALTAQSAQGTIPGVTTTVPGTSTVLQPLPGIGILGPLTPIVPYALGENP